MDYLDLAKWPDNFETFSQVKFSTNLLWNVGLNDIMTTPIVFATVPVRVSSLAHLHPILIQNRNRNDFQLGRSIFLNQSEVLAWRQEPYKYGSLSGQLVLGIGPKFIIDNRKNQTDRLSINNRIGVSVMFLTV